jgi:dolichol-phosphate mannosyltransferase
MISVVIPIFNEIKIIDELRLRCIQVLEDIGDPFEIIFVDDGSFDGSLEKLIVFHQADHRIKVVELSRNFGHQMAITAGLESAGGAYIVVMDGDLQDPPEIIPQMISKMRDEGLDVVNAARETRGERLVRKMLANLFHRIFSKLADIKSTGSFGNFALMNRLALKSLLSYGERTRYLPGLRANIGFRQGTVSYSREKRKAGRSKMSVKNLFNLAFDAFFSFTKWPIKMAAYSGIIGIIFFLIIALIKIFSIASWPVLTRIGFVEIALLFLGCVQLLFIGIIGEYIFRTYRETQRRPGYFIRNKYLD